MFLPDPIPKLWYDRIRIYNMTGSEAMIWPDRKLLSNRIRMRSYDLTESGIWTNPDPKL